MRLNTQPSACPCRGNAQAQVYDITDYIEDHPGGMAILNNAGGDATEVRRRFTRVA